MSAVLSISRLKFVLSGILTLALLLAVIHNPAHAQVLFGSMVGNVTDATDSAVPGANIKITDLGTNEVRTFSANQNGAYNAVNLPAGTYSIEITKEGFRTFAANNVLVNQNNVVRVDARLEVGAQTEKIEVSAEAAVLQTDRADVHAELSSQVLQNLPQPNRTWESVLTLVPGTTPPNGQLSGGTNNPSKSMQFSFNGQGLAAAQVRIEGVSAMNPWVVQYTTFVPSVEAIENVNIVTNAADSEQALAGGASVNVRLKSGSNSFHGSAFEYNVINKFEANNFFTNQVPGAKPAHLVNNNPGVSAGGHIIRNKLFYFGSYEGDYLNSAASGILSLPNATMLSGNESGSSRAIYDPLTGTPDGKGRTPFAGNLIPKNRVDPVVAKLLPYFPAVTFPNLSVANDYVNQGTVYNLHKMDTKFDYVATDKLRFSGRWGYQPYYNVQQPIYGPFLGGSGGFPTAGAGNYLQHGATLAVSGSGTYTISPTFLVDATFGVTQAHQLLFPTSTDQRVGADLGIPGANTGPLPWAGGLPNFNFNNTFVTAGYSYPALEYKDPIFEYMANGTKTVKSHTVRFGFDIIRQHQNHIEVRPTVFTFSGNATALNGGASANEYNQIADFLLGQATTLGNYVQYVYPLTLRTWEVSLYMHDQWQVNRKLTVNYGVRYERYPVPTQENKGIGYYDQAANQMWECGVGGIPGDCGIHVSHKLFAPSIGIAYRASENFVIRAGYSLSPQQDNMGRQGIQAYPDEAQSTINGANGFAPAGTVSGTGAPVIPLPVIVNGKTSVPAGTGNLFTNPQNFVRGYIQSYNFTLQRQFKGGMTAQVGYVGGHSVNMFTPLNFNYAQLGGGTASQPLFPYGINAVANRNTPFFSDKYNALQSTFQKRYAAGFNLQAQFTYSHDIGPQSATVAILVPQYRNRNNSTTILDRTFNFSLGAGYELPFGKGKPFLKTGVLAAIAGGWNTNGIFTHFSGVPFTVTAAAGSCNCTGNQQIANQVLGTVDKVGNGVTGLGATTGTPYFNPLAFAPVTGANFGTSSFNGYRGPGATNLDFSILRNFSITERLKVQIRAEALNLSNTPHFGNPVLGNLNVSNYNPNSPNLGGFDQITQTQQLSRLLDQRYFRFGFRLNF